MNTNDQESSAHPASHQRLQAESAPSTTRRVPRWLIALVIAGALLTAAGAVLALLPSADHLNAAGRHYADYFVTRNFALSLVLLAMLARRSWPVLAGLMTLTALIQSFDAVTALATGQFGLVPIDLVFAGLFLVGAARLSGHAITMTVRAVRPDLTRDLFDAALFTRSLPCWPASRCPACG